MSLTSDRAPSAAASGDISPIPYLFIVPVIDKSTHMLRITIRAAQHGKPVTAHLCGCAAQVDMLTGYGSGTLKSARINAGCTLLFTPPALQENLLRGYAATPPLLQGQSEWSYQACSEGFGPALPCHRRGSYPCAGALPIRVRSMHLGFARS